MRSDLKVYLGSSRKRDLGRVMFGRQADETIEPPELEENDELQVEVLSVVADI